MNLIGCQDNLAFVASTRRRRRTLPDFDGAKAAISQWAQQTVRPRNLYLQCRCNLLHRQQAARRCRGGALLDVDVIPIHTHNR